VISAETGIIPGKMNCGRVLRHSEIDILQTQILARSGDRQPVSDPILGEERRRRLAHPLGERSGLVAGGPLADVDDHELGGLDGGYADDDVQPPVIKVVLGHGGLIAADKEGLLRRGALELARVPFGGEEVCDGGADTCPESLAIGLEDGPLGGVVEGVFQVGQIAADVDFVDLRGGIGGVGAQYLILRIGADGKVVGHGASVAEFQSLP
jgi:hypothetical protein